ncbi:exonuclease domain-containing protein [Tenacibaculum aquimarinum]|uniref:exonuclease domain-containing protein n=1 Tax=Tenacibaculum aquimarinum TaxID=2910675 RepID=UPI001F0A1BA1|nr:exonuclease domain-containing protein [Tenacibaculum aquimarinum]MCH3883397.1 transposase [Tenacibaculum aquimarinum]
MDFLAIDVETANSDMASICQIGFVIYENGQIKKEWSSLINPEDYFDFWNESIHNITEDDVIESPKFPEIYDVLKQNLENYVCVCHTHFDRVSINRTCEKYGLPAIQNNWIDTAKVARRCWNEFAYKGYGLANVCKKLGYSFNHHDALEDAKASAHILISAIKEENNTIDEWITRGNNPILANAKTYSKSVSKEGNPDGNLFGEVLVFTGSLQIPRREASVLASEIGCSVVNSVTKKTTLLVVGDQDISRLSGKKKSSKHLKAEELKIKGQNLRILKESDFVALYESNKE